MKNYETPTMEVIKFNMEDANVMCGTSLPLDIFEHNNTGTGPVSDT